MCYSRVNCIHYGFRPVSVGLCGQGPVEEVTPFAESLFLSLRKRQAYAHTVGAGRDVCNSRGPFVAFPGPAATMKGGTKQPQPQKGMVTRLLGLLGIKV